MSDFSDEDTGGIRDQLQVAIDNVLGSRKEMSGHWIALVESYDENGQRAVYVAADNQAKGWDTSGLLQYGLHMEAAELVAQRLEIDQ